MAADVAFPAQSNQVLGNVHSSGATVKYVMRIATVRARPSAPLAQARLAEDRHQVSIDYLQLDSPLIGT